jgi:6-phosphogluconate dehydrogenase (decarboxylating)
MKVGLVGLGRMARRLTERAAKPPRDFREFMPQAYE